jgi:hypothetical protein
VKNKFNLMKNLDKYFNKFDFFWLGPLVYALLLGYLYLNYDAMVPDESNFIGISKRFDFFETADAPLGYGALYWLVLSLGHSPIIIRFFFLIFMFLILILFLKKIEIKENRYTLFIFFLGLPFSFWSGKLIGPEILMVLFLSLGLYFAKKDLLKASLFIGLAIGIKLQAIFVLFYFLTFYGLRKTFQSLALIFLGVFLANPLNFRSYFDQFMELIPWSFSGGSLVFNGASNVFSTEKLQSALFGVSTTWDLIPNGSFSMNVMNPYLLLITLVFGSIYVPAKTTRFLFSLIALTYFMTVTPGAYGWYWFTMIPILLDYVVLLLNAKSNNLPKRLQLNKSAKYAVVLFICLAHFTVSIPNNFSQISEKQQQIENIQNFDRECVLRSVRSLKPDVIYFKGDFGIDSSFLENLGKPIYWQFDSPSLEDRRGVIVVSSRLLQNEFFLSSFLEEKSTLRIHTQCGELLIVLAGGQQK